MSIAFDPSITAVDDHESTPEWEYVGYRHMIKLTDSSRSTTGKEYEELHLVLMLSRFYMQYIWNIFVFAFAMVTTSWVPFALDERYIGDRLSCQITLVLTIVMLKFSVQEQLPKVAYQTVADLYFTTCFLFVFFAVIQQAFIALAPEDNVLTIDRWSCGVFGSVYFLLHSGLGYGLWMHSRRRRAWSKLTGSTILYNERLNTMERLDVAPPPKPPSQEEPRRHSTAFPSRGRRNSTIDMLMGRDEFPDAVLQKPAVSPAAVASEEPAVQRSTNASAKHDISTADLVTQLDENESPPKRRATFVATAGRVMSAMLAFPLPKRSSDRAIAEEPAELDTARGRNGLEATPVGPGPSRADPVVPADGDKAGGSSGFDEVHVVV